MPSRTFIAVICLVTASVSATAQPPSPDRANAMMQAIREAQSVELPTDPAAVIAVVGENKILLGDIKSRIDAKIKDVLSKTSVPEDQLHTARVNLTRGALAQLIQSKMLREGFMVDQVGTQDAAKRAEANEMMTSRARQMFYESEVPEMREKLGASNLGELDDKLRVAGSSLAAREREFVDGMLGQMFLRSSIDRDPKITLAEIKSYYDENVLKYEHKAQVKWEQLTVSFEKHPDREEAKKLIWEMGREAFFGGNMQAVARAKSEEPFASGGGLHDWTNQGALASQQLDDQLFSLPLDKMSQIIEDDDGYHIIRILGRRPAGIKGLPLVQTDIEKILKKQKVAKAQRKMMVDLQKKIPVWSIFPKDVPGAKQLEVRVALIPSAQNY